MKNAPYTSIFQCGILIAGTVPCANIPGTISATNNYAQYGGSGFGTLGFAPNGTGGNYYMGAGLPATSPNRVVLPNVDPATATNPADYYGSEILAMDVNFRPTYVEQYSLGVQKDFAGNVFGVNYVGNLGRRLVGYPNLNQAPYNCPSGDTCTGGVAPTPIASLPTTVVSTGVSQGKSSYNALQLSLERRMAKGLSGNANYTYGHNLSNISTNGEAAANIPNPDQFSCVGACHIDIPASGGKYTVGTGWQSYDYGNSEIDVRHRVAITLNYDLPFGAAYTGLRGVLLKGWATNALWLYQTGLPFTVENSTSTDDGGTYDGFTNSPSRPNIIGSLKLAHPGIHQWFNTASFAVQDPGTLGNEGKNVINAPRVTALNFSLFKTFSLPRETSLQLRAESFNLTNTPSFNPPDNNLGDATFGVINSTIPGVPPRQIQFAAKILF